MGDTVHIGAMEYSIVSYDDASVTLSDPKHPLLMEEIPRDVFERRLRENPRNDYLAIAESRKAEPLVEEKPDSITFSIGFSEHTAFYDRQHNDRFTDLSFALGNRLLGVLDEKQYREKLDKSKGVGRSQKTNFEISAVVGGEDVHYEGQFDIGDGEGDLITHIKNFYDYCLSPNCYLIPEWKRQGEDYYRGQMKSLRFGRDVFIPFLEQHTELTPEDEKLFAEIMATETDWDRRGGQHEKETSLDTVDEVEIESHVREQMKETFVEEPHEPSNGRLNYQITDDALGEGGAKAKFRRNMEAIRTLQRIEQEERVATSEEQEILAKYVGWGGLAQIFEENNRAWADEFDELRHALSPEDYESARASTLNAHYTAPVVIRAIYKALANMGFERGNILEIKTHYLIQRYAA